MGFNNKADAQSYGGNAYAWVKDSDGNKRVITSSVSCVYDNESEAKQKLEDYLHKRSNEEYISGISYSISSCD